jgi:hypothetical protein
MIMEIELCTAAGINVRNMELLDVYLTAGKIINDEPLRLRAMAFRNGSVLPKGSRVDAIKEMTPDERRALRERVTGIVPFKR